MKSSSTVSSEHTWGTSITLDHIKAMAFPVPFPFQRTRRTPHTFAWLPRHLRQYALDIGLSVLDFHGVNACVILRPNNFDPPCDFLSKVDTLQDSHSVFEPHSSSVRLPHPAAGRLHLDMLWWTAGAETSERGIDCRTCRARSSRLPSLPQASR